MVSKSGKRRSLKTYPGLKAADFMHPFDVQSTEALRSVPGLDTVTKKVMEYGLERLFYLENIADNVRVTPKMFPKLYRYLQWSCQILEVPEPEMYVTTQYELEAFTYGHTKPFIVLSSGLIDLLDEEERFFVIARELGHIKCEHVLYTVLARNMAAIMGAVSRATFGLGSLLGIGLALPLYKWYRNAELSADRAALLCVQDVSVGFRVLMRLAGGASSPLYRDMDQAEFLRQVRDYEQADESKLDQAYKLLLTVFRTHPFPIMRAKYLDEWVQSGEFTALSGIAVEEGQAAGAAEPTSD